VRVIKIIFGLILTFSGVAKIGDPAKAVDLMFEFKVIPESVILLVISILTVAEILVSVLLISGIYLRFAIISASVLFSGFLLVIIYGTLIGLNSDSGCFGSVVKSEVGWWVVMRNLVFVAGCEYEVLRNFKKRKLRIWRG